MGFVDSVGLCMAPGFTFPGPTEPGLPNFLTATLACCMGGINYVLDFIPPSPTNVPSLPTIDIFLNPFMAAIKLPPTYPGIALGPLTIPGVGSAPYQFDPSGMLKLMAVCIVLPFQLISNIVTGIIHLAIELPTIDGVIALFADLGAQVGLPVDVITKFGGCLASAIVKLFTDLIPA